MVYGGFKDSARRTASDKVLKVKAFNIAKNPKYDGYQRSLASIVYKCFTKNLRVVVLNLCQTSNLQMNFIKQLLKNLKGEKYILPLKTIFGVLIWQICN